MTPTVENRIAFARGIAHLLLTHVKDLSARNRRIIQNVTDATTAEQMRAAYASTAYAASAYTSYASASVSAASAVYAAYPSYWINRACEHAIKAGVPEDAVYALRGLLVTE